MTTLRCPICYEHWVICRHTWDDIYNWRRQKPQKWIPNKKRGYVHESTAGKWEDGTDFTVMQKWNRGA